MKTFIYFAGAGNGDYMAMITMPGLSIIFEKNSKD